MIEGRYFDGHSGQGRSVQLEFTGERLRVTGADFEREFAPGQLVLNPSHGSAPARIVMADGAQCEVPNGPLARELLAALGARPGIAERLEAHRGRVLAVLVALVLVLAGLYRWGIPLAADLIVDHAPPRLERSLGEAAMRNLENLGIFRPSVLPEEQQQRIRARLAALRMPPRMPPYHLEFRAFGVPNAFALPGGTIVVGDDIVTLADDDADALLTVIGHELGHVYYRHAAKSILQGTLVSALSVWYFGDVSALGASAVGGIASLRYSRAAEHQADLFALQLMHFNGRSTWPAAELFRRLEAWVPPAAKGARPADAPREGGDGAQEGNDSASRPAPEKDAAQTRTAGGQLQLPEYLSTHPDIDDRIRLFEAGREAGEGSSESSAPFAEPSR